MSNPPASFLIPGLGLVFHRQIPECDSFTPALLGCMKGEGPFMHPKSPLRHKSNRGENLEGEPIIFSTGEGLEA